VNVLKTASVTSLGVFFLLGGCAGNARDGPVLPARSGDAVLSAATTSAFAAPATGTHLATIRRRRALAASGVRAPQVNQVTGINGGGGGSTTGSGGAKGVSCTGGCTGGSAQNTGHGTVFNVAVTAPTAGQYKITGYTTDSHGVQTAIPSYTVTVSPSQAGPTEEVNSAVYIPSSVDMANGISITITGPNANSDSFDPLCDTGTGSWDFSPFY
jgi:hypothetical protein